jgi:HAD superfamily hydrolase (TIGR01450 family)
MTGPEDQPLLDRFDAVVCDLDGVVYRGAAAVDGAAEALRGVRAEDKGIAYATNNASRPPGVVAEQLRGFGLELSDHEVVTSAQAGARAMLDRLAPGAAVLAVGGPGVALALAEVGLRPVLASAAEAAEAAAGAGSKSQRDAARGSRIEGVLQGFGTEVAWSDLAEATYAIVDGAVWIATNADATLPTERGTAPGNGTLVAAVARASGAEPFVVGKPHAPLYELATAVLGSSAERTLAVGDRIDTDIAGAHAAGLPALLVLTGVDGPAELAVAERGKRPRFVATDLSALHRPYLEPVKREETAWSCGAALVRVSPVDPAGVEVLEDGDPGEVVRAALAAVWKGLDEGRLDREQARRLLTSLEKPPARDRPVEGASG